MSSCQLFNTHIVVDWSARHKPSGPKSDKDAIWWAAVRDGKVARPEYARTRHDAIERLASLITGELKRSRRTLIGFDFPFGYPAGVARHVTGEASALALWRWFATHIRDAPDNTNNRFDVAETINRLYPGIGPFWGRTAARPPAWHPELPAGSRARTCRESQPPDHRIADRHAAGAKTVWQLCYPGCVGSQILVGLPALLRLAGTPQIQGRCAVWPFETGLEVPPVGIRTQVVFAEIYPSLLKDDISQRRSDNEILDRAQVRVTAEAFARLDVRAGLAPLFEGIPGLKDSERRLVETEEAWILGLGHVNALRDALRGQGPETRTPLPARGHDATLVPTAYRRR